jgi:putative transposase
MRGRRNRTTRLDKEGPPAECLKRNFATTEADKIRLADITYVATGEGFLYLAFILDVYSRRIVGWAMEGHLRTDIVVDALQMAVWRKKPASVSGASFRPRSPVHGGVQYTALTVSLRGSKRWASSRRWEGSGPLWTTPWPNHSSLL